MAKKFIIPWATLMMCLGIFTGCGSGIKFNIGYDKIGGFGSKEVASGTATSTLEITSSLRELKFCATSGTIPRFKKAVSITISN
jgi:hypothetical protein